LIPIEVKVESEFEVVARTALQVLQENQIALRELIQKDEKGKSKNEIECFKCCRRFVHESGLFRHWDKHIGELLDPSPLEDPDKFKMVTLCVICGEVFSEDLFAWNHLQSLHMTVVNSVEHWKIPKSAITSPEKIPRLLGKKKKTKNDGIENDAPKSDAPDVILVSSRSLPSREFIRSIYVSKVFQCEFCDAVFANAKTMLRHSSQHMPLNGFHCNTCDLYGLCLKEVLLHRRDECILIRDHRHSLKDFPCVWFCNVCDGEFPGLEMLIIHR
jgi:hypothetical protein